MQTNIYDFQQVGLKTLCGQTSSQCTYAAVEIFGHLLVSAKPRQTEG